MKIFNFFGHVFTIFAFLTLGSLLIIFGIHLLALDDALLRVQEIYASPWKSLQTMMLGLIFITFGLAFTKNLVKKSKLDAFVLHSEIGPIVISSQAIEDVTRKVLKKFHLVKDSRVHAVIRGNKDIQVSMKLILWSGVPIQDLIAEIQEDVRLRLKKLVGKDARIEVGCDVHRVEDHESDYDRVEEVKSEPQSHFKIH
jgi:hypothetical protein